MPMVYVDVDLDDFDDDDLAQECKSRGISVLADSLNDHAAIVERAYMKARQMTDLPAELKDLFWHVHGRALA